MSVLKKLVSTMISDVWIIYLPSYFSKTGRQMRIIILTGPISKNMFNQLIIIKD